MAEERIAEDHCPTCGGTWRFDWDGRAYVPKCFDPWHNPWHSLGLTEEPEDA